MSSLTVQHLVSWFFRAITVARPFNIVQCFCEVRGCGSMSESIVSADNSDENRGFVFLCDIHREAIFGLLGAEYDVLVPGQFPLPYHLFIM